ncbi:glycosyltransferase family protein [Salix suchowensis]|nr:glycosyltransferase family protein [Salix suchowensis]
MAATAAGESTPDIPNHAAAKVTLVGGKETGSWDGGDVQDFRAFLTAAATDEEKASMPRYAKFDGPPKARPIISPDSLAIAAAVFEPPQSTQSLCCQRCVAPYGSPDKDALGRITVKALTPWRTRLKRDRDRDYYQALIHRIPLRCRRLRDVPFRKTALERWHSLVPIDAQGISLVFSQLPQSLDFMGSYKSSSTVGEPPTDSNINVGLLDDKFYWDTSKAALDLGIGHEGRVSMDEQLFLSKAFGVAMGPSRIIPFYYKATSEVDQEDITITTLITSNRFSVFARLVEHYQERDRAHSRATGLSPWSIHLKPSMSAHVDVHLVIDNFERQFNMWRNIARLFARTDYIMMLDVDFALCTDFRRAIRSSEQVVGKLKDGNAAFVIPAFEYTNASDGTDSSAFPRDKDVSVSPRLKLPCWFLTAVPYVVLLPLVDSKRIGMFHASWGPDTTAPIIPSTTPRNPGKCTKLPNISPPTSRTSS